jgi:hypothetical protein
MAAFGSPQTLAPPEGVGRIEMNDTLHDASAAPRCLRCGYLLVGLPESRCPECGQLFDLSDPTTFTFGRRDRTILEIVIFFIVTAVLGAHHDMAEALFEFIFEAAVFYTIAIFFAVVNDKFWLSPALFFSALVGTCFWYYYCVDYPAGQRVLESRLILLGVAVGIFGALSLVAIKSEVHSKRRRGETDKLMTWCEYVARHISWG